MLKGARELRRSDQLHRSWFTLRMLGIALEFCGQRREAIETLESAVELSRGHSLCRDALGWILARDEQTDRAEAIYQELSKQPADGLVPPWGFVAIGLRDPDRAIEFLERSYEIRDPLLICKHENVFFGLVRDDPRTAAVWKKMGLE